MFQFQWVCVSIVAPPTGNFVKFHHRHSYRSVICKLCYAWRFGLYFTEQYKHSNRSSKVIVLCRPKNSFTQHLSMSSLINIFSFFFSSYCLGMQTPTILLKSRKPKQTAVMWSGLHGSLLVLSDSVLVICAHFVLHCSVSFDKVIQFSATYCVYYKKICLVLANNLTYNDIKCN